MLAIPCAANKMIFARSANLTDTFLLHFAQFYALGYSPPAFLTLFLYVTRLMTAYTSSHPAVGAE